MAVGAKGVVSVASNIIPKEISNMVKAIFVGKLNIAQKIHTKYYPLFKDLFIETNPIPIKAAMAMLGMIEEEYRLPLVPMNPKNRLILKETMERCGISKEKN